MISTIHLSGIFLIFFINNAEMMSLNTNTELPSTPIEIKSVDVTTSLPGCTNVTVTFIAKENIHIVWTVQDGFLPQDLNGQTTMYEYDTHRGTSSSICLPKDLNIVDLKLHLISEKHSFELHVGFKVSHNMTNTSEDIKQYILLVPENSEVGVSSHGEARFHVMVDTVGTDFLFGLLQTDASVLYGHVVQQDSAFSFLPDNRKKLIRFQNNDSKGTEYHTDVILKTENLQKSKSMVSVSAACTRLLGVVNRLDIKKVLYIRRKAITSDNKHSVAIVGVQKQEIIPVEEHGKTLLKCTSFGIPRPNVTLHRKVSDKFTPYILPSYTVSLKYEQTKVFQVLNATMSNSGLYICKASNKMSSAEKTYVVNVQKL